MLLPITRILWPTDFSDPSYAALESALELCAHFSAELVAIHIVPEIPRITSVGGVDNDTREYEYRAELKKYEQALLEGVRERLDDVLQKHVPRNIMAAVIVTRGEPACEIVRTAEDQRASLIVIATHGLAGWRQVMFGSVAERVVRLASQPVLTIRCPRERR